MLRTGYERFIQTVSYEIGGLAIATPIYALLFDAGTAESALLMVALSIAVLTWMPIFNTACDWLDLRLSGRVASDRPLRWRLAHAAALEVSTIVVTLPLLVFLGGHGIVEAILLDLGLTALYAVYGFVFHLVYDHLRPVARAGVAE